MKLPRVSAGDKGESGYAEAYNNYGNLLTGTGHIRDGLESTARPSHSGATIPIRVCWSGRSHAAGACGRSGRSVPGLAARRPDHPIAQHLLAACSGIGIPARASDAESRRASTNSPTRSMRACRSRIPRTELKRRCIARACGEPKKALVPLDAGCGTGSCGLRSLLIARVWWEWICRNACSTRPAAAAYTTSS